MRHFNNWFSLIDTARIIHFWSKGGWRHIQMLIPPPNSAFFPKRPIFQGYQNWPGVLGCWLRGFSQLNSKPLPWQHGWEEIFFIYTNLLSTINIAAILLMFSVFSKMTRENFVACQFLQCCALDYIKFLVYGMCNSNINIIITSWEKWTSSKPHYCHL